jgi:hypothetical protein
MAIGLNTFEIFRDMQDIFQDKTYNEIYAVCVILFGKKNVSHTYRTITVKDKVNIFMHLSNNETKIYIDSYIIGEPIDTDIHYKLSKLNYCFRFFCSKYVIEYLQLKHTENEYIKTYEG